MLDQDTTIVGEATLENIEPKKDHFWIQAFLVVVGITIFFYAMYFFFFSAPVDFPKGTIITIEKGESLRSLSLDLKQKKIIRFRVPFETFVILLGGEKHIAQGDYLFEQKLGVFGVAEKIVYKDRGLASKKITIPEGFDLGQIAEVASSQLKDFDKDKFITLAKEGYLFPDTYFFFSTDTEQDVIEYMTENFNKKTKTLENDFISSGKGKGAIITMASLIERESKGDSDRGYISGILWRRIGKGMPLQVDSAPITYKNKGLPKEPICNPGIAAILSALHPISSPYLYYLHDKNGVIHYAKTFEEHKKNKLKYL